MLCAARTQYLTEHPYGWLVALATGLPAFTAANADAT